MLLQIITIARKNNLVENKRQERFQKIVELRKKGYTILAIAEIIDVDKVTVQRYLKKWYESQNNL